MGVELTQMSEAGIAWAAREDREWTHSIPIQRRHYQYVGDILLEESVHSKLPIATATSVSFYLIDRWIDRIERISVQEGMDVHATPTPDAIPARNSKVDLKSLIVELRCAAPLISIRCAISVECRCVS